MRDEGRRAIMSSLSEDMVRRMRNWAAAGACGGRVSISSIYSASGVSSGYAQASMPHLAGEAADVDAGLAVLPAPERAAVSIFWWYEGASLPRLAERLRIDYRTLQARIERGHEGLRIALWARRARLERVRAESEAAILAARMLDARPL